MKPLLSIVVTSRNDNHGGDAMKRMNVFLKGLIAQTKLHQFTCELIFVDWNPPADKPLLFEVLPKPSHSDYLKIKYVIVPPEIHQQLRNSHSIPLFQMIAKNVGIRRSSADFILCTNIDLLFSSQIFEWIKSNPLQKNIFYRANRCDVPSTINESDSVAEQLKFCENNIKKRLGMDPQLPYDPVKEHNKRMFKYAIWWPIQQYAYLRSKKLLKEPYHIIKALDADACGDFTLMHRDDWMLIKGYQELEMYSLHIDTIALMSATAMGLIQTILPKEACTYHLQHGDGWDTMDPLKKIRFYENKPSLDWYAVTELGEEMIRSKKLITVNKENWGYADQHFQEYII